MSVCRDWALTVRGSVLICLLFPFLSYHSCLCSVFRSLTQHGLHVGVQQVQFEPPKIVDPAAMARQERADAEAAAAASQSAFAGLGSSAVNDVVLGGVAVLAAALLIVQCGRLRRALRDADAEYEQKHSMGNIAGYSGYRVDGAYMDGGGGNQGLGMGVLQQGRSSAGVGGGPQEVDQLLSGGAAAAGTAGGSASAYQHGGAATIIEY